MEERIWRECQHSLSAGEPPPLRTLSAVRSLAVNPSTSGATVSSIIETLTSLLCLPRHHHHLHILSLLSAIFLTRPTISPLIFSPVFSLFSTSTESDASCSHRLPAAALSLLLSISDSDPTHRPSVDSIKDDLLIALIFRPCVQARMWLLNNAVRLGIEANLLVTVFLGFTKDPYPGVRRAALDGLSSKAYEGGVAVADCGIVEGCFLRSVELLRDDEDHVRAAAVRVVSRWGQMLMATKAKSESDYKDCSDFLFIQLCSMVRDMSVAVRLEAFFAIASIKVISDDILLLTLSKRVPETMNVNKFLGLSSGKQYEVPVSTVAGAFLHGLEDEFSEVRGASCKSLQKVSASSSRFSSEAATLLMGVMNDESVKVRMQALETARYMALCNRLKLQQEHIHMLLATNSDKSPQIRSGAMEVFGLIKLPNMKLFKLLIGSLLGNLGLHPQDEAKILCAIFKSGQGHSRFASSFIEDAYKEMTNACGKLAFDKPEMIGLVVLAISVSLSIEAKNPVLQRIISDAGIFLGRISDALREVMNQETLQAYIAQSGRPSLIAVFKDEEQLISCTSVIDIINSCKCSNSSVDSSLMEMDNCLSETLLEFREGTIPLAKVQKEMPVGVTESVKLILATANSSWQLEKSSCTSEALTVLRCCQEEMDAMVAETTQFSDILDFGLHYVGVIKLLIKLRGHVMFPVKHFLGMGCLDLLLNKLEKNILHLRHRFTGFSKEDELHIWEFVLITYVFRLYILQRCCKIEKKLSTTISHVVHLCQTVSVTPSGFVKELEKLYSESCSMRRPFLLKTIVNLFDPKDIVLSKSIKHIKAELEFHGFDAENPFPFVSELPVGVPCEITLYNVPSEQRLWLDMKVDGESSQLLFLDLDQFGGCNEVMKFVYNAPLYRTPNAAVFALTVKVGMECFNEEIQLPKGHVGPRFPLIYLCEGKEIELFRVDSL